MHGKLTLLLFSVKYGRVDVQARSLAPGVDGTRVQSRG